jgi:hypothetical protein
LSIEAPEASLGELLGLRDTTFDAAASPSVALRCSRAPDSSQRWYKQKSKSMAHFWLSEPIDLGSASDSERPPPRARYRAQVLCGDVL